MLTFPDRLGRFLDLLLRKLARGSREYGDRSFARPLPELLDEWQDECVDIVGWGYVTWLRIENLREEMRRGLAGGLRNQQAKEEAAEALDLGPKKRGADS